MEAITLIILIIIIIILFIGNLYLMFYYLHPEDNSICSGVFTKIIVLLAMMLCWIEILLLPLDVLNTRGLENGLRIDLIWTIFYIIICILAVFILPILIAYNECDNDWSIIEKFKYVLCYYITILIVISTTIIVTYFFFSNADFPFNKINCSIENFQKSNTIMLNIEKCNSETSALRIKINILMYFIGVISFFSWILFVIFCSIGFISIPFDFIYEFKRKPQNISKENLNIKKQNIINQIKNLKVLTLQAKRFEDDGIYKKSCMFCIYNIYIFLSIYTRKKGIYKFNEKFKDFLCNFIK